MIFFKYFHIAILCFILSFAIFITGCDFDDPYVPDEAGSSSLTGRITTEPEMDLTGTEVLLRGQDSFAGVIDASGIFSFQDIPPGDYILYMQKNPYLQEAYPVKVRKSIHEDMGIINTKLKGAISGTIPNDKVSIVHGEVDVSVYVDGVPLVIQEGDNDIAIELSSDESNIIISATTKITVYIDKVSYPATVRDDGTFIVEFVPPGIYNDIQIKLNSIEHSFPIVSDGPVVVKSGQTRYLSP